MAAVRVGGALRAEAAALRAGAAGWRAALAAVAPLLDALANLAAQMQAARRVALHRTQLRAFPELGPRLRHKQCGAAAALRDRLARALAALQQVRDAASGRVGTVFQLYEEAAAELGLEAVVQRSALSPSLADALAWLQDVERYYRQAYLECKLLLLRAHHEDLSELEALPQAWEGLLERHNPDIVEDTLLKVSLFLETG